MFKVTLESQKFRRKLNIHWLEEKANIIEYDTTELIDVHHEAVTLIQRVISKMLNVEYYA